MVERPPTQREPTGLDWPRGRRDLVRSALVTLAIGLVAAVSGPFGTFYDLGLAARMAYWLTAFAAGWAIIVIAIVTVLPRLVDLGLAPIAAGAVVGVLGALPLALVVFGVEAVFRPSIDLPGMPVFYLYVALFGVPVTAGMTWANWRTSLHIAPAEPKDTVAAPPAFFARLPAKLGVDLVAIKAEDHYLRIYTAAGNDLLLMRLADAVDELEGYDGLRVHRSYWVARAAIERAERTGRRSTLHLVNGLTVPVSRSYVADLKARGWLRA